MDYIGDLHEPRTNAEQSETGDDLRVSYVSEKERRFRNARNGGPPMAGAHLYFIQVAKGRGPVKIGRANDPLLRLATLQVGSPYRLKLLGVLENSGPDETDFHHIVRASRLRGEWFGWSKHVEETVKLALAGGDWRTMVDEARDTALDEWRIGSPLYAGDPRYPQYQPPTPNDTGV